MSSNWNKACVGLLHTSVVLDDVADNANGRGTEIDCSVFCDHGDVDIFFTNGVLLVGLSEGSNGIDDDDKDDNFDEDEGVVDANTDVTILGLLEGEDTNGRKAGCVDVNGSRSLLAADDDVRLGDVSGGGPDKTPVSDEEEDGSEVCEILDLHASPKSNDASLLPKLLPSMTSLSS
jgi:hypothetical protein